MQETVLAGADPSQPAIDAATGQPLTIEELLRRRGLLAYGGNSVAASSVPAAPAAAMPASTSPVAGAIAARSGVAPTVAANTAPVVVDPAVAAANPSVEAVAGDPVDGIDPLTGVAIGVPIGVAGAYAYNKLRNRKNKGPNGASFGADDIASPKPGQLPNGTAVHRLGAPNKRLTGPQARLTGPAPVTVQSALIDRSAPAGAAAYDPRFAAMQKARIAAAGSANPGVIAAEGVMPTIVEAPEAGLERTLGVQDALSKRAVARMLGTIVR